MAIGSPGVMYSSSWPHVRSLVTFTPISHSQNKVCEPRGPNQARDPGPRFLEPRDLSRLAVVFLPSIAEFLEDRAQSCTQVFELKTPGTSPYAAWVLKYRALFWSLGRCTLLEYPAGLRYRS